MRYELDCDYRRTDGVIVNIVMRLDFDTWQTEICEGSRVVFRRRMRMGDLWYIARTAAAGYWKTRRR